MRQFGGKIDDRFRRYLAVHHGFREGRFTTHLSRSPQLSRLVSCAPGSGYAARVRVFALLKAEGPLPVAIDTDMESYLAGRRAALDREIEEVARLADQGKLDGVDLTGGELVISPVQASTPPEAEKVKEAAYALLPASKITDVLLDVDSWTGFN